MEKDENGLPLFKELQWPVDVGNYIAVIGPAFRGMRLKEEVQPGAPERSREYHWRFRTFL